MRTVFTLLAAAALVFAQQSAQQNAAPEIHTLKVQGNVYMIVGGGGNTTFQIGEDGVAVVDSKSPQAAPRVVEEIRKLTPAPIVWLINTHLHADHTGGNEALLKAGATDPLRPPRVIAHESVLDHMVNPPPGQQPRVSEAATINDTYFGAYKDFFFNGEPIFVYHVPAAHTDGDSMVFFRRSDVIATGDLFTPERYPVIDMANGGNVQGVIDALNKILEITVPRLYQEGGTYVVPGHGRLCDEADVVEYRDMVTIIRDRVQDLIDKGQTLDQVKAARPTRDYDTRYGATTGFWTTDMFVEAVYNSLKAVAR
jgi:glyoxylase-like metal-dependent hydrolase (beta-lactamase superfamily II)